MSTAVVFYPWHQQAMVQLQQHAAANRLAHAWLLSGAEGSGKLSFARYFANYLLCRAPLGSTPCGTCKDCQYFSVGTHPDWRLLQPETKLIKIEQIRDAIDFASNKSQRGGYQILCVYPAENMNHNAANALLKLLEEPPPQTLLLLVSHQPGLLMATLRSRCQKLLLPLPERQQAITWLEQQGYPGDAGSLLQKAQGAPLRALAMSEAGLLGEHETIMANLLELLAGRSSPVMAARKCEKISIRTNIEYLMQSVALLLKALQTQQPIQDTELQDLLVLLPKGSNPRTLLMALHTLHGSLGTALRAALASNNPNPQLILEQVFGECSKLRHISSLLQQSRR